jgi:hypothetical protein
MTSRVALAALVLAVPLGVVAARAQTAGAAEQPSFAGSWVVNRSLSDDAAAKIAEVAGADTLSGAKTVGGQVFFPRGSYGADVDRLTLRQQLLEAAKTLDRMEVEQEGREIRTIHGEDGVRIFHFDRESTGTGVSGAKLVRRTRWQGSQLTLESESGKTRALEVLTLVPARNQLIHVVRYEDEHLKKPLELKLVYDRAQ